MQLEIDLALPGGELSFRGTLVRALEEIVHLRPARGGQCREGAQLFLAGDHLRRHAAAAIAIADGRKGVVSCLSFCWKFRQVGTQA